MSEQNGRTTEETFTADVAVQGVVYKFNAQTVSIRGPGTLWYISAEYKLGNLPTDLLLSLDLVIDKAELPGDGTLKTFDLSAANGRKAYGRCGYFIKGVAAYDMVSISGLLEIAYDESTQEMSGTFEFDAAGGGHVSSVTNATFSLAGIAPSTKASGSVTANIKPGEPEKFVSTAVDLSFRETPYFPAWIGWAEHFVAFPYSRTTLSVYIAEGVQAGTYDFETDADKVRAIYTVVNPLVNSYTASEGKLVLDSDPASGALSASFNFIGKHYDPEQFPPIEVTDGKMDISASKKT